MATVTDLKFGITSSFDGKGIDDAQAQLRALKATLDELGSQRIQLKADSTAVQADIAKLKQEINSLDAQIKIGASAEGADATLADLKRKMSDLQDKLLHIRAEDADAVAKIAAVKAEMDGLRDKTVHLKADADPARAAIRDATANMDNNINGVGDSWKRTTASGRASTFSLVSGLAALAIGMAPVAQGAVAMGGAIVSGFASGGLALGAYGLALKGLVTPAVQMVQNADHLQTALNQQKSALASLTPGTAAYNSKLSEIKVTQSELNAATSQGTSTQNQMAKALLGTQNSWHGVIQQTSAFIAPPIIAGIKAIGANVGRLTPLIDAVATALKPAIQSATAFINAGGNGASTKGLQGLLNWIQANGIPIIKSMITVFQNVIKIVAEIAVAFGKTSQNMASGLAKVTGEIAKWGAGGGFVRFQQTVQQMAPKIKQFLDNLGLAFAHVTAAAIQMGPSTLTVLSAITSVVAKLPTGVIQAFFVAFGAYKTVALAATAINGLVTVVKGVKVAFAAAQIVIDSYKAAQAGLNVVTSEGAAAQTLMKVGVVTQAVATWAVAAATGAWAIAQTALNVAVTAFEILLDAVGIGELLLIIGLILAAIAALIIGVIELVKHWRAVWDGLKTAAVAVWHGLVIAWDATIGFIVKAFHVLTTAQTWITFWHAIQAAAKAVWDALKVAWNALTQFFPAAWNAVSGALKAAWNAVWPALKVAATAVWDAMKFAWNAVTTAFTTVWNAVSGALKASWGAVWGALKIAATTVWDALKAAWNAVTSFFASAWTAVSGALSSAWNTVWTTIKVIATTIWDALKAAWDALLNGMKLIWDTISSALSSAWNTVWTTIKVIATTIWDALKAAWDAFINGVKSIWDTVSSALSSAWNTVWNTIKTVATTIWDALKAAWDALINGVKSIWDTVSAALKSTWDSIWNAIKTTATTIWDALKAAWNALINGIKSIWDSVSSALKSTWNSVWSTIKTIATTVWDVLKGAWDTFVHGVKSVWDTVSSALSGAWHTFWSGLHTAVDGAVSTIKSVWNTLKAIVGDPINFVIAIWDVVAKVIGVGNIPEINDPAVHKFSFAEGGHVQGPGTETSDSIPALLSHNEFVLNAGSVRKYGLGMLHDMNAGRYAAGGLVGPLRLAGGGDTGPGTTAGAVNTPAGATTTVNGKTVSATSSAAAVAAFHAANDGSFSWVTAVADKAFGVFKNLVATAAYDVAKPLLDGIVNAVPDPFPPAKVGGPDAVGGLPKQALKTVEAKILGIFKQKQDAAKAAAVSVGVAGTIPTGLHQQVIDDALKADGIPQAQWGPWEIGLNTLIGRESAWNASAVNRTDSNAAAGTPSEGLAQVIAPTFAAYRNPSLPNNLLDPVANVAAAINYIIARYGSIGNVQQANANLPPKGYADGTWNAVRGWHMVGERGPEWVNFHGGEHVLRNGHKPDVGGVPGLRAKQGNWSGGGVNVEVCNNWYGNPDKEAVQEASSNLPAQLRQAIMVGAGTRSG